MENSTLFKQLLATWQSLAMHGVWYQDALLLLLSVAAVAILFLTGTVIGLFLQSLWGIFTRGQQRAETDPSHHP